VVDEDDVPLAHIPIRAMHIDGGGTGSFSGPDGRFKTFPGDGKNLVSAGGPDGHDQIIGLTTGIPTEVPPAHPGERPRVDVLTYYPGVPDKSAALPIDVSAGHNITLDIKLLRVPAFHVAGKVSGSVPGYSPGQLRVGLMAADAMTGGYIPRAVLPGSNIAADGSFDLAGVPAGDYYLIAATNTGQMTTVARQRVLVDDRDIQNAALVLRPLVSLSGTITIQSNGKDVAPPPGLSVDFYPQGGGILGRFHGTVTGNRISADGLTPGTYVLGYGGLPAGVYTKTETVRRDDRGSDVVNVGPDGLHTYAVVFDISASRITGSVRTNDGKVAIGSLVAVVPDPATSHETRWFRTDSNGQFEMPGVVPGKYRIYALKDTDVRNAANPRRPELSEVWNSQATRVEINGDDDKVSVNLTQIVTSGVKSP
jgi:hypothetical protein